MGLLYAAVSAYWAAGGTAGLDSVGGGPARLTRDRDPGMVAVLWVTVGLKLLAALPGLALARRRWWLPRRPLLVLAGIAAAVLAVYGGVLTGVQALVKAGVVESSGQTDRTAFHGHLFLWDPWFLVWGLLLGLAVYREVRSGSR
nr:DUF3995 domain-containing protein [Streptomyces sp. HNM0574]